MEITISPPLSGHEDHAPVRGQGVAGGGADDAEAEAKVCAELKDKFEKSVVRRMMTDVCLTPF